MKLRTVIWLLATPAVLAGEPQPPQPDSHTFALFRFDKDEGNVFASVGGKGGTVQRRADARWTAAGRFGGGLEFIKRARPPHPPTTVTLAKGGIEPIGFAVDFWFKLDPASPIIGRDFYLVSNGRLYFRYSTDRRALEFGLLLPDGWVECSATPARFTLTPGQWVHMAGTYDGSELRLYLNGQRIAVTPGKGDLAERDAFVLGCCAWNPEEALFCGVLSELRFSNLARTEF